MPPAFHLVSGPRWEEGGYPGPAGPAGPGGSSRGLLPGWDGEAAEGKSPEQASEGKIRDLDLDPSCRPQIHDDIASIQGKASLGPIHSGSRSKAMAPVQSLLWQPLPPPPPTCPSVPTAPATSFFLLVGRLWPVGPPLSLGSTPRQKPPS